jgi:predicted ATPase/DNA-binding XRE family transcriptional regulator
MDRPRAERRPRLVAPPHVDSEDGAATVDLAALLKSLRVKAGLSQQMLAERALISVQAVSALERGYRKVPYRKTLERIADALGLSAQERSELELSARRARGSRLVEQEPSAHNLPRRITSLLGRDEVVREIAGLVATTPLVSIVGTGGVGKTRAAIEVGTQALNRFPDGVWFVELAPLGDAALVSGALAAVLRIPESPRRPLLETLVSHLAHKRALLIFDNCEHVIDQARRVVGSLLRECPEVALLTTSREPLSIGGERVYRIPPLAVPVGRIPSPEEALTYGAVALFADRVRAADARFAVTLENVEPIVEICRRLDGLPLAIELAAARATVLSAWQIVERLDGVFELLTSNGDAVVPRHRTMRAVIDWSYDLLSAQARTLFDRISVFAGGFTLDAAAAVCADEDLESQDILETLSLLINRSLVMVDFSAMDARYHLLESMRQYAQEKLAKRGERQALAHRHARVFLDVAERLDRDWYEARERSWFNQAQAELDNFRVALGWALSERRDLRSGRLLAGTLERVWYSLAPVEGRRWVRLAIESIDEDTPPSTVLQLYIADAELCGSLAEYKARLASAEAALRIDGRDIDELQIVRAKLAAGSALGALGRSSEAEELLGGALAAAQQLENRRLQALILGDLGTTRSRRGDIEGARRFYAEALAIYVALDLERPAASIAGQLAEVEFASGDAAAALQRAEEARAGHEATQNRRSVANDLGNMAAYLVALDCFDDARTHAKQALHAALDVEATVLTACVLQHVAAIDALQHYGDERSAERGRERAAMLMGFVEARLAALEAGRDYTEQQEYDRVMSSLRAALGDRLSGVMSRGATWKEDGAVALALEL